METIRNRAIYIWVLEESAALIRIFKIVFPFEELTGYNRGKGKGLLDFRKKEGII
ncbi:MAG: hypothetical protein JSW14_05345 [Candidatus Bathyarchaeum sp.]|nr:MAG: hypothetical protein JSW14_05345 [Candidatus Bathyarchaeum sp.]